jgi:type II secretory pathway pseudopilin PulG
MKYKNMVNSKKGYTLVELLIFMGMLSMLLVVFSQIFGLIVETRLESESTSAVAQDGNYILNRLTYDINRASAINTPATLGATEDNLDITIDSDNFAYSLNNGNLELSTNGSTYLLNGLNTSLSNLTFTRIGNDDGKDTVRITYTVNSLIQEASGIETEDYQTTVGLR